MAITKKQIRSEARDLFYFFLISIVQALLTCPRCNTPRSYALVIFFTFVMWIVLWKGNEKLTQFVSSKISWLHTPGKRFIVGLISTIAYTVLSMIVTMWCFEYFFSFNFGRGYYYTLYGSIFVTIMISLFLHGQAFLSHWRLATIDREKYEKESAIARYESLKNQVNPHFLFNSFNALSNLVYEDQDKAVKFIKQLSDVYRYVLDTRDKEVVPVKDELQFLQSYMYLQHIRFGDKLRIVVDKVDENASVAPLALQMLIENAIKHNVVSEDDPLTVHVFQEDGYLVVENNLQKKTTIGEPSAGVGLENISKRYTFLNDRKVQVIENEKHFVVKLPLLTGVAQ